MTNSNASHSVSHRHATNESSSNVSSKLFITALIIELTTLAFTHVHRRWIEVEEKKRLMNETKRNCVYEDIAPFYMQLSVEF